MTLLAGCSTLSPVTSSTSGLQTGFANRPVSVVVYAEPEMSVLTPGDVVGAGLIDALTRPDGSNIPLPSPSYLVAKKLREILSTTTPINLGEVQNILTPLPAAKTATSPNRDTLEVFTDINYLSYRPFAWQTYQYMLLAHARLVGPSGNVVWQGLCTIGGNAKDESLQLDRTEFKNNNGAKLVEILNVAADRCAKEIASNISGREI